MREDNQGNEVYYAILSLTILSNSSLGTLQDARRYFEKVEWLQRGMMKIWQKPKESIASYFEACGDGISYEAKRT